ncbi:MAG TPA: hemolysin family protein [Ktedonobacteraceae bacterium]|nr:hemolysin family protein [Ktedonobacteraceae bacterium]
MDGAGQAGVVVAAFHVAFASQVPQFDTEALLQLIILIISLILCAMASGAETALTSVSRIKLKNLVEEGDKKALEIERLTANPNIFLSTILVVNSVAVIIASSMTTVLALRFFPNYGELIGTILISLVVLIFCEITPKTTAVQNPIRWARVLVNPVRAAAWLLHPLIVALSAITNTLVRLMGGQMKHRGPFVTEEELRLLVNVGEEEGVLEEEETDMIHSIFEFADTTVREVMIPRIDMITLESDATVDEAVDLALQGGFSRIPVYEETIDNIIGVLFTKDMLKQLREGHNSLPIRELVRPPYFVPESKKLDDLLHEIRQKRTHMAIVVDEYGSVAGLVTIEDLVEEIVGDIQDEYDREENLYEQVSQFEYIFNAKINLDEFNELMNTDLENEGYDTLGGFLLGQLDKIPVAGDTITFKNLTFTVLTTRGLRITKVRVEHTGTPATANDSTQNSSTYNSSDQSQSGPLMLPPGKEDDKAHQQKKIGPQNERDSHYEIKEV